MIDNFNFVIALTAINKCEINDAAVKPSLIIKDCNFRLIGVINGVSKICRVIEFSVINYDILRIVCNLNR
jgi:hypothetical protein